jgi:hypothetical protein
MFIRISDKILLLFSKMLQDKNIDFFTQNLTTCEAGYSNSPHPFWSA